MEAKEIMREFPNGILNWYQFRRESTILYIRDKGKELYDLWKEEGQQVVRADIKSSLEDTFLEKHRGKTDYIVVIGEMEYLDDPIAALIAWRSLLRENGRMLLGMNNRLGLRYFCGDRDNFTGRNFDGIENYRNVLPADRKSMEGRNYSREEICAMLEKAGLNNRKIYSVLPSLKQPQLVYAENYTPTEELGIRFFPMYDHPDSVFTEEEFLYTDIIKNGMFHAMANAYLIECSMDRTFDQAVHVTVSMDRGKENALATIIRRDGKVEKRILYEEGKAKLKQLQDNARDLKEHGIKVVEAKVQDNTYVMPYMDKENLVVYLRRLAKENLEGFKNAVDKFRDMILQSSDWVTCHECQGDDCGKGVTLRWGYLDMVPLNCFFDNGTYLFYDQEFREENYPANAIIYRAIDIIYLWDSGMESILPRKYFWKRYHLEEQMELWQSMAQDFSQKLRNGLELRRFLEKYQRNPRTLNNNRQKINFSEVEYRRIFVDLFKDIEDKRMILFGSGNFTRRFLAQFGKDYPVYRIIDNNSEKWGRTLEGILIEKPELLKEIPKEEQRIIICVKGYVGIVRQLKELGINNYCIYDPSISYPRKQQIKNELSAPRDDSRKKYNIGYMSGVFDLFHVGHLNMFKRAKEQCRHLIVGVVTDEGVRKYKKTEPFIPFSERIEMVRSCRYVDEAVEIPLDFNGTEDAYNMYHFDCQFSGSDYAENPYWLAEKAFLQKQGSDLVFFPYTEGTSSTKIKKMIEKSLL